MTDEACVECGRLVPADQGVVDDDGDVFCSACAAGIDGEAKLECGWNCSHNHVAYL